ncbi:RluA family pseudouridine synthase [Maridesulfovibrio sp. FT414]|uniref:RluA family pseudouridine synthase n=1 Tax=Maridesulfovibrio sp. FT414 TaxID=2979469 RepID=UPI003D8033A2
MPVEYVTVTGAESGQKLVRFLERRLGSDVPRSAIMRWIRKGNVRVDKGRCKPFDLVEEGQVVRIPPHGEQDETAVRLPPLPILFEDSDYIAVFKPAGLATQGGTGHTDSVVDRLKSMFADSPYKPAPAHRLDRDTSGVLLAGKSHQGQKNLSDFFAGHGEGGKLYLVQVQGKWPHAGWIELRDLMEKSGPRGREIVHVGAGREAGSSVCPVESGEAVSTLVVRLHTGRTHQIRVQLSSRGFPVAGDVKYGGNAGVMRLHCWRIVTPWFSAECLPEWMKALPDSFDQTCDLG